MTIPFGANRCNHQKIFAAGTTKCLARELLQWQLDLHLPERIGAGAWGRYNLAAWVEIAAMAESGLGTFVTYNPLAVSLETTIDRLLEMVEQLHMHHFPVVDDDGRLVGIVSETDILGALHRSSRVNPNAKAERPVKAETLAARQLVTIGPEATPRQALDLLLKHGIHSVPVLTDGRLLGIVTSSDFLREYSYGELTGSKDPVAEHLPRQTETVEPDVSLDQALLIMQEIGCAHLAVVQGGCPVGLVSQSDIIRTRSQQQVASAEDDADLDPPRVMSIMRRTPPLRPGQRLCEAAALMIQHQLPALVVTNQANRFLGVLCDSDLLTLMLRQLK